MPQQGIISGHVIMGNAERFIHNESVCLTAELLINMLGNWQL